MQSSSTFRPVLFGCQVFCFLREYFFLFWTARGAVASPDMYPGRAGRVTRESSGPETGSALTTLRESKIQVRPMVAPPFYLFISRSRLSAHRVCVGYSRLIAHPHDSLLRHRSLTPHTTEDTSIKSRLRLGLNSAYQIPFAINTLNSG